MNNIICKCLVSNLINMSNFHSLYVVVRHLQAQLQVDENLIFNIFNVSL